MKPLAHLSGRLSEPDAQQYLALYLIALLFALLATWPAAGQPAVPNDAWFALAYTRAAALGVLGLGFGESSARAGRERIVSTAAMLSTLAVLALPLELAAFAASYPDTPLYWVLALPPLTALAMFALGVWLGKFLRLLRIAALAPLVIPGLLVGMVVLDVAVGINILNPFTGAVRVSWPYFGMLCVLTLLLLPVLLRDRGTAQGET